MEVTGVNLAPRVSDADQRLLEIGVDETHRTIERPGDTRRQPPRTHRDLASDYSLHTVSRWHVNGERVNVPTFQLRNRREPGGEVPQYRGRRDDAVAGEALALGIDRQDRLGQIVDVALRVDAARGTPDALARWPRALRGVGLQAEHHRPDLDPAHAAHQIERVVQRPRRIMQRRDAAASRAWSTETAWPPVGCTIGTPPLISFSPR